MSELELKYNDLLWQINNLELAAPAPSPPPTPGGVFIPAGTIITCRPSRAVAMIKRLGGEENVEIVDSVTTEGFARGRHKDAALWTNEVYPYDIGPSCGGTGPENVLITSDTDRVSAPPVNNCITADNWNPALMFDAGGGVSIPGGGIITNEVVTCARVLYISDTPDMNLISYIFKFRAEGLFGYGGPANPWYQGNLNIGKKRIYHESTTFAAFAEMSKSNRAQWENVQKDAYPIVDLPVLDNEERDFVGFDTEATFHWYPGGSHGYNIKIIDPNALYIVVDDTKTTRDYVLNSFYTRHFGFPYKISIFTIEANNIQMAVPTPVLKYGGYDRKNPPGSGPPPKWSRTNLVQLKILQDVTLEA